MSGGKFGNPKFEDAGAQERFASEESVCPNDGLSDACLRVIERVKTMSGSPAGSIASPWPARDVVQKLVDASGILLNAKGYDGHGYEEIYAARDVALKWLKSIRDARAACKITIE